MSTPCCPREALCPPGAYSPADKHGIHTSPHISHNSTHSLCSRATAHTASYASPSTKASSKLCSASSESVSDPSDEYDVFTLDELTLDPEDGLPAATAPSSSARAATRKGPH